MKIRSIALLAGLLGLVVAADPQRCAKQDDCPGGYSCTEVNKSMHIVHAFNWRLCYYAGG